jgi:putative sigma-54 modulation protein
MHIHLSPRHLQLTAAIHQAVAAQIGQLEELGGDILAAHVVLVATDTVKPKNRFTVKVHLALAGPDIFAEDSENDLYIAIDLVTAKLARQLRKRKTALNDKRRAVSQRTVESARNNNQIPRSVGKSLKAVRKAAAR